MPLDLQALVAAEGLPEARAWYALRSLREFLKTQGITSTDTTAEAALGRFYRDQRLKRNNIMSEDDLTAESRRRLQAYAEEALGRARTKIGEEFDKRLEALQKPAAALAEKSKLPPDRARVLLVAEFSMRGLSAKGSYPRGLVDLWLSLLPADGKGPDDLAKLRTDALLVRLNATTLAMLYDEAVTIAPAADGAAVTARMRYRYAMSHLRVDARTVAVAAAGPTQSEVKTIDGLTGLVNHHLDELVGAYPPLERVVGYARVAAVLRWAAAARADGRLAGVDLTGLAAHPAHDRTNFPTADAIKR